MLSELVVSVAGVIRVEIVPSEMPDEQWFYALCNISSRYKYCCPWWRHQMEAFSALLAFCEGIHWSPADFPHKGQWRGALMFSLDLNKRLCKLARRRGFEAPSRPLKRHCNAKYQRQTLWSAHQQAWLFRVLQVTQFTWLLVPIYTYIWNILQRGYSCTVIMPYLIK